MAADSALVFLVRHARAEDSHPAGDATRALTAAGRAEFREHAAALADRFDIRRILTSPVVRAVQTAELLAMAARVDEVEVRDELTPTVRAASRIIALCNELKGGGVALVGHNPSFTVAASRLLGLEELPFRFKKGGLLALRHKSDRGWAFDGFAAPGKKVKKAIDG